MPTTRIFQNDDSQALRIPQEIRTELFELQDLKYREFLSKLIPTVSPDSVIGVRTPALRKMAKKLSGQEMVDEYLNDLPHRYFEENQLHAFIVSEIKNFEQCIDETDRFLPYMDNWATCDQMSPKVFRKHKEELLQKIKVWINTGETYTVRFAIKMLMEHFLDEDYDVSCPELVAEVRSEEYYVKMMIAWYFATGLAKQYETILPYIENNRLDPWTHNKAIQKAVESYRITDEQKEYLKSLKVKKEKI